MEDLKKYIYKLEILSLLKLVFNLWHKADLPSFLFSNGMLFSFAGFI